MELMGEPLTGDGTRLRVCRVLAKAGLREKAYLKGKSAFESRAVEKIQADKRKNVKTPR